jgi:hypothetical protein
MPFCFTPDRIPILLAGITGSGTVVAPKILVLLPILIMLFLETNHGKQAQNETQNRPGSD